MADRRAQAVAIMANIFEGISLIFRAGRIVVIDMVVRLEARSILESEL